MKPKKMNTEQANLHSTSEDIINEHNLFTGQSESILKQYAVAKLSMLLCIPVVALITFFSKHAGFIATIFIALATFFLFKYLGKKAGSSPAICAFVGLIIGLRLLPAIDTSITNIKEVFTKTPVQKNVSEYFCYDYTLKYNINKKPLWMPLAVYDDGQNTFIEFSSDISSSNKPSIFSNDDVALEYSAIQNPVVLSTVFERLILRKDSDEIIIQQEENLDGK